MKQIFSLTLKRRKILKTLIVITFALLNILQAQGQNREVTGQVVGQAGNPLPFVSVSVKGTNIGVVTDQGGAFKLSVPENSDSIVFSFVGYETAVREAAENMTIVLNESFKQFEEVVVIGYGVQKKSDLTGAVASVKVDDLNKNAPSNVASALQGRAAGVQVTPNSGAPGSEISVRIRGISSINNQQTLWIVDGVAADPRTVNINDIESFEILKDASSAAIYGSNGANGVILITTKKGKQGKTSASFDYYHGIQDVSNRIELTNGAEFGLMYNEYLAIKYPNGIPTAAQPSYGLATNNLPSYDYQDLIFRQAAVDNLNISMSGGSEKSSSYLGIGLINQEGILKATNYKKLNVRLNNDYQVTPWLKLGESITLTKSQNKGWSEGDYANEYASPIMKAIQFHPYIAPYDSTGNWIPRELGTTDSPLPDIDMREDERNNLLVNATFFAKVEPVSGFSYETKYNQTLSYGDGYRFYPTFEFGGSAGQYNHISAIDRNMHKSIGYTWQNILNYKNTIFNQLKFELIAGHEVFASKNQNMSGRAQYLLTEDPEMWYFDASTDTTRSQFPRGSGSMSAGYSYLGRINLNYKDRYLFQGNFRRDYSSKFGPNSKVGNFPGFSVGWKFSEETFIKNTLPFLTFGKLRYAFGRAGNNAVRDYAYYATIGVLDVFQYPFNNNTSMAVGAAPDVLPNKSIHWEDIETQNIGLDLWLIDNKISFTIERFLRHNIGMLVTTTMPGYAGWTVRDSYQESANVNPNPIENVGKITNKGWEISMSLKDNLGDLSYSFDFNYTYVLNIASDLGPDSIRWRGSFLGLSNFSRTETGKEIGNFWGYKVDRLFNEEDVTIQENGTKIIENQPYWINNSGRKIYAQAFAQPGDFKFKDINGDGMINTDDMDVIGNPFPKNIFSLNMDFTYKRFDLTMFWYAALGHEIYNAAKYTQFNQSGQFNWSKDYYQNHYRSEAIDVKDENGVVVMTLPANTSAKYPRIDPINRNRNFDRVSDFYIENGSYLRLKNIQLGYTLPTHFLSKINLNGLRFYIGATNLLTFTKYTGMDPELSQADPLLAGLDKASYPQARTFTIGANIKF
jgi:TonB-linked SusC/RagA family outer membrane protein